MSKTSKNRFQNIVMCKCPACHTGKLFKNSNPYNLKMLFDMHNRCEHCNQNFNPEPSFYYGAMYVSYAFSVAIFASVFVGFNVLTDDMPLIPMTLTTILLAVGLSPLNFRLSRSVWAHFFMRFDKEKSKFKETPSL